MSGEMALIVAICLPIIICACIWMTDRVPNIRDSVVVFGSIALFVTVLALTDALIAGDAPHVNFGQAVPGLGFTLRAEPLGILFALIASGLWIVNSLYSIGYMRGNQERHQTRFYMCFAIALCGAMGVALAGNLFTLFVFYELLTLSTYPLVAHKGDSAARRGARIYLLTLLFSSIGFLLVAIVWTGVLAGSLDFVPGGLLQQADGLTPVIASALLLLFAFGIGKAALMPLHFWLPSAMVAPTPVSALLHAVAVVKAGVFTMLKVAVYIFGEDILAITPAREFVLAIACFTIIAASLIALAKDDLKARLAYSTVAQLAYVTCGAMLANSAGFLGGSLQIAAHAVGKITLFMCAGAIYVATGARNVSQMAGLGRRMPLVFIAFFIASLSIIGIPPFIGGWSKFALMLGASDGHPDYVIVVLIVSSLLNIAYLLPIAILALMPPGLPAPIPFKRPGGAPVLTVLAPCLTAVLCLILFFYINPLAAFLEPVTGSWAPPSGALIDYDTMKDMS